MSGPLQAFRVIECAGYLSATTACYVLDLYGILAALVDRNRKGSGQ
jgi:crotonobetainyl-CoA:carnitine CoA-transferase CaiB-like acyl-CoA transferase